MEKLLELLKDGKSRSLEMIAMELGLTMDQVKRDIEFLERAGVIKKVPLTVGEGAGCTGCSGCAVSELASQVLDGESAAEASTAQESSSAPPCHGCMPEGGFQNMGTMWEVEEILKK